MVYLEIFLTFLSNARLGDGNWNISEQGVGGGGEGGAGSKIPSWLFGDILFLFFLNIHSILNAWVGKI